LPLLAWAIGYGVLRRTPKAGSATEASVKPSARTSTKALASPAAVSVEAPDCAPSKDVRRRDIRAEYGSLAVLLFLLTAVIPATGFFTVAYRKQVRTEVKYSQLRLSRDIAGREERLKDFFRDYPGVSSPVSSSPTASLDDLYYSFRYGMDVHPAPSAEVAAGLPAPIADPLTWIPHAVNASAISQVWLFDAKMGALSDSLVHIVFRYRASWPARPPIEQRERTVVDVLTLRRTGDRWRETLNGGLTQPLWDGMDMINAVQ